MAEAGVDGDEVVGEGKQQEGPGKESGGRDAAAQGEAEAEESSDGEEGEVERAAGFVVPGLVGGVGTPAQKKTMRRATSAAKWAGWAAMKVLAAAPRMAT